MSWDPFTQFCINAVGPMFNAMEQFGWIGEATHFVKLDAIDAQILPIATSLGMDLTLTKYTFGLFLVYPFSAILYYLPNKNLKHLFSFVVGLVLVQWIFGADWIHTFLSSLGTYLICLLAPKKYQPTLVFFWAMTYMTLSHMYRMYVSYLSGIFDFTGTQMVLTMKLTSFAYNLYDGTYDYKNVYEKEHPPRDQKLYLSRRKYAITKFPNPLEFFGYIYCFTCILAGPAFEYRDYCDSIDDSAFQIKEKDGDKEKVVVKRPTPLFAALLRLLIGVVCMVGFLQLSARYRLSDQYKIPFINSTQPFERYGILMLAMFAERLKYYFAWKIAEGASILGGFGFEGYDKDGKSLGWSGVENIDIIGFETAANIQTASRSWNKRTQGWLERYTYSRTNKSLLATYFISALWHGLYPGFFIVFLTIPILTNVERLAKAKINPILVPGFDGFKLSTYPKTLIANLYWIFSCVMTVLFLNYTAQVFSFGSLERANNALGGYYYAGHVISISVYILLELFPSPKKDKAQAKKSE